MHRTDTHKPVIGLTVTGVLTALYYWVGDNRTHDLFSTSIIALSFGIAALVIGYFTERWSWRAVGVMIAMAGTSIVYTILWGKANDLFNANPLLTRSILRASLDVGGVLLFLGLLVWAFERRNGRSLSLFDWMDDDE